MDLYRFDCDPGCQADLVECHFDFLVKLMNKRCLSLAATYLLPPIRYAGVLDSSKSHETQQRMQKDFQSLLKAEAMHAGGEALAVLHNLNWRLATLPRLCFMASERSLEEVANLMRCCTNHVGDSALIENVRKEVKASWLPSWLLKLNKPKPA